MYDIPPGQMAYSGISNVLNFCKNKLYDPSKRTVRLSINIDGLPLYRSSKVDLWPILGRIEEKKIFPIAVYAGKKKPRCSNLYLKTFVEEVLQLKRDGIKIHGRDVQICYSQNAF